MKLRAEEISSILKQQIESYGVETKEESVGSVLSAGDGIARIYGLRGCMYGELLRFENGVSGMAMNLEEDNIGCVLLGEETDIGEGMLVRSTGTTVQVPVGEALVGRVVNALGKPLDGKGEIKTEFFRPVEFLAPGVIDRKGVSQPLQTGIMAVDALTPIGRGQRGSSSVTGRPVKPPLPSILSSTRRARECSASMSPSGRRRPPSSIFITSSSSTGL